MSETTSQSLLLSNGSANGSLLASPARMTRWIMLCDELSAALLATARHLIGTTPVGEDQLDHLKELVTVGHRLFALERALADTPALAGEPQLSSAPSALLPELKHLLDTAQTIRAAGLKETAPSAATLEPRSDDL